MNRESIYVRDMGSMQKLIDCRLCRKVAFAVFLAILIIELIILIPSYQKHSRDWQSNQASHIEATVKSILLPLSQESRTDIRVVSQYLNMLISENLIEGWALYDIHDGSKLADQGSYPSRTAGSQKNTLVEGLDGRQFLDSLWLHNEFRIGADLQVRMDASELSGSLDAYVIRILWLVLIITLFVTLITMVVLYRYILSPILSLRQKMKSAGEDIIEPENYLVSINGNDELGDVAQEFNDMLQRTGKHLKIIHQNERNLYKSANYDVLTGLPNRLLGFDRLEQAIKLCSRQCNLGALVLVDVDGFKKINDTYGHAVGDNFLKQIAERFSAALRNTDSVVRSVGSEGDDNTISRIGGDEFMVILPNIDTERSAALVAERLCRACKQPIEIENKEIFIDISLGISIFPRDGLDPKTIMVCADTALYAEKEAGGSGFRFFDTAMNENIAKRLEVETELRYALSREEFELHYQPLISIADQSIIGVEALLRWANSKLGRVSPERFISIAESTGLIVDIGDWVLRTACQTGKTLAKAGFPLNIAVNVSSRQFRDQEFLQKVQDALSQTGIAPNQLEIEITESLLVDEYVDSLEIVEQLRELGIKLSIDDFGTGYSALSYLRRVPVDTLKIDRSFINGVDSCSKDASLARTIVAMAHNFGLKVVAEGVETENQLLFLKQCDCDYGQGYYFGRPMELSLLLETLHIPKVI